MKVHFLTVAEVAADLRVSKMTVYRACQYGHLAHVLVGKQIRIRPAAVDAWLEAGGESYRGLVTVPVSETFL